MNAKQTILALALLSLGFGSCAKKEQLRKEQFDPVSPRQTKTAYLKPQKTISSRIETAPNVLGNYNEIELNEQLNTPFQNNLLIIRSYFRANPNAIVQIYHNKKYRDFTNANWPRYLFSKDADVNTIYEKVASAAWKQNQEKRRKELMPDWYD